MAFSQDLSDQVQGTSLRERLICEETPYRVRESGGGERVNDGVGMENGDVVRVNDGEERASDERVNDICVLVSENV